MCKSIPLLLWLYALTACDDGAMATTKLMGRSKKLIALASIIVLAAGVGASSILGMAPRGVPSPTYTHRQPILDDLVTVEAGSYQYYEFAIPEVASNNAAVQGKFSSEGSEIYDSDIVVTIIPKQSLASLQEGKGFEAYYFSGKVSSGNVDAKISGSGTVYIVLDNRFSSSSDKAVSAVFELAY